VIGLNRVTWSINPERQIGDVNPMDFKAADVVTWWALDDTMAQWVTVRKL